MSDNTAFLARYQGRLDLLKSMTERRVARSPTGSVFASHLRESDKLAVMLDYDLALIRQDRHPAGSSALLEVAHHAILLHLAREMEAQHAERLEFERKMIEDLQKKATEEIQRTEDRRTFDEIDQALKPERKKPRAESRPKGKAKGRSPKRRER